MKIQEARFIQGWMNDSELTWLAEQASKALIIIELGSFHGRSTRALADNTQGTIFAIDTWRGSTPYSSLPAQLDMGHEAQQDDSAFITFCQNLWDHICNGKVIPLRMDGGRAAKMLKQARVEADFIFIDADHVYEKVRADIENYRELIKQGGMIAGHDYRDSNWPGVNQAVDELFLTAEHPADTNIWAVKYA